MIPKTKQLRIDRARVKELTLKLKQQHELADALCDGAAFSRCSYVERDIRANTKSTACLALEAEPSRRQEDGRGWSFLRGLAALLAVISLVVGGLFLLLPLPL